MKALPLLALFAALTVLGTVALQGADTRCYELRVYYAAPGKLDALNQRFREHTCQLFEKHGMVNVGYWMPLTNSENKLVYMLAFPSREAREASWKAFFADPEWQRVAKESEKEGKIVQKVDSTLLAATDFSPDIKVSASTPARVFELRTYTATPGRLEDLLTRFRDHTVALFTKHGMTNFGYWTPMEEKGGAGQKLIYLLAHSSAEAGAKSFATFRADPDWVAVKKASEDRAGGSLTVPDGVKSELLAPTDYSPTK